MDYYQRLRPWTDIAFCDCANVEGIVLVYTLHDNPVHCLACKGVLDPEHLGLTVEQVDAVAKWSRQFRSLYELWLDSDEYEDWAKARLLDPRGQVNRNGLDAASALSPIAPTWYWWFHCEDDDVPETCPSCAGRVVPSNDHGHARCEACRIIV